MREREDNPIMRLEWVAAGELTGNDWNPNYVMTPELRLLERSIVQDGWIQPILITAERMIIDGFHRVRLVLESASIRESVGSLVPCAVLALTAPEAMFRTIRMNRAKGTHAAFRMSAIIKRLMDEHGYDPQQIAREIGATMAEIDLLYQDDVFTARNIADYRYSRAWVPREVKSGG